jgi:putative ABC transport system ATP-binding protein
MLHTRNLSKVFRHGDSFTQALINVNIDVGKGEFVSVVGPSGCGKTTLMGIMGLLEAPDNGEVFF